jgi:hypothetical protein
MIPMLAMIWIEIDGVKVPKRLRYRRGLGDTPPSDLIRMQFSKTTDGRPIFHLVHGTFAPNADWVEESSVFCNHLRNFFNDDVVFRPFRWSGKNSFSARATAKTALIQSLDADLGSNVDSHHFLCAHSHGGSIVAYAYDARPDLADRIAGTVFLSTPFYTYRLLPSWRFLVNGLLSPIFLIVFIAISILVANITVALTPLVAPMYPNPLIIEHALILTLALFASYFLGALALIALNRMKMRLMRKYLHRAIHYASEFSCRLPPSTNALCVRASGDEASAGLGFAQTVSWFFISLNVLVARVFEKITSPLGNANFRHHLLRLAGLTLLVSVLQAASLAELFSRLLQVANIDFIPAMKTLGNSVFASWYYSFKNLTTGFVSGDQIRLFLASSVIIAIGYAFVIILIALTAFFLASLGLFVINWVLSLAFGRLPFLVAGLLQVAVEPTPPGQWRFVHVTWNKRDPKRLWRPFWRHSHPYGDANLLNLLCDWANTIVAPSNHLVQNVIESNPDKGT